MTIATTYLQRLGVDILLAVSLAISSVHAQNTGQASPQQTKEDRAVVQDSVQDEANRQLDEKRKELLADATAALDEDGEGPPGARRRRYPEGA